MEKKSKRPTVAQVKALENEIKELKAKLNSQIDGTSHIVKDCDDWREEYHNLLDENKQLKQDLKNEKALRQRATDDYVLARDAYMKLKKRTLWQRILNK